MINLVKEELTNQTMDLKDRLLQRKLSIYQKTNNKKVISPNLSNSKKTFNLDLVENTNADNTEVDVDNMLAAIDDDSMLDVDSGAGSDEEDGEDADDDPELLLELEQRQETIIEQFLEVAYEAKQE